MKLNYKRTLFVGFAFFLICAFWQAYDNLIPKLLTDKFGMPQVWSGIIMALDNVFAVFLLPVFGAVSDRKNGKHGRRTPFILIGTVIAAVLFVGLSFADSMQLTAVADISASVGSEASAERDAALSVLYASGCDFRVEDAAGKTTLSALYPTEEDFLSAVSANDAAASRALTAARQAYAWKMTCENPVVLVVFIVLLLGVLVAMSTFRSPAVALMPDVTPKPLRSKGNAVINLMGAAGGVIILVLGILLGTGKPENALMHYTVFFMITSLLMLVSLAVFLLTVKEPAWAAEAKAVNDALDAEAKEAKREGLIGTVPGGTQTLNKNEFRSLLFILLSVVLWFMGYNAVTSKYSVYAGSVLGLDYNLTLIVAQAAAIVSYIPVGILSQKIGRKKTILAGVVMLGAAFGFASFLREGSSLLVMNILFALAGIGWATINVNSYPMVVELASSGDVGKYTGFYYTASMAAQIVTPVLSGAFLTYVGMTTLFPYAAIFVALAFVTMLFVRHGDVKPAAKKDLLEHLDVDDG